MVEDPIVEEIHEIRRKMWVQCGEDIEKFIEMISSWESADTTRISSVEELQAFVNSREQITQENE